MTKWPGEKYSTVTKNGAKYESDYDQGWNDAIDAYRAALNKVCSRKNLAEVIRISIKEWEADYSPYAPITPFHFYIADSIREHLELEGKKEVKPL